MRYKALMPVLAVMLMLLAMVTACTRQQETGIEPAGENKDVPETVIFMSEGSKDNKTGEAGEVYEKNKFLIEQKDADMLLTEALEGTDCKAVFEETLEIGDDGYYTYTVTGPDGEEIKDRLAVNGFSGEVFLLRDGKTKDFSEFSYYDASKVKERDINWEGDFVLDNLKVSLVPEDDLSFEFSVYKKNEKIISGAARVDGGTAFYESDDEKLEFKMTDDKTLQLVETGHLRISGQYTKEQ